MAGNKGCASTGERSGGKLEKCVSTNEGAGEEKVHTCSVNFTWLNERLFPNGATGLEEAIRQVLHQQPQQQQVSGARFILLPTLATLRKRRAILLILFSESRTESSK